MKNKKCIFFKIIFIIAGLLFSGCEVVNFFTGYYCNATDGSHPESIEITWGSMNGYGENEETGAVGTMEPESYTLKRDDVVIAEGLKSSPYFDSDIIPGVFYNYCIKAIYPDGTSSRYTTEDRGHGITASILPIGSSYQKYFKEGITGPVPGYAVWYEIMAQAQWTYTIETYSAGAPLTDTHIYLCETDENLTEITHNDNSGNGNFSRLTYTFPDSGLYYIKVATADVSKVFNITMWHH